MKSKHYLFPICAPGVCGDAELHCKSETNQATLLICGLAPFSDGHSGKQFLNSRFS